jgi:hypothetical protein
MVQMVSLAVLVVVLVLMALVLKLVAQEHLVKATLVARVMVVDQRAVVVALVA